MRKLKLHRNLFGALGALVAVQSTALGAEITPDLKQEIMTNCAQDAYRLCPLSLSSVNEVAACMRQKRTQLGQICRVSFDRAVRVLAQK